MILIQNVRLILPPFDKYRRFNIISPTNDIWLSTKDGINKNKNKAAENIVLYKTKLQKGTKFYQLLFQFWNSFWGMLFFMTSNV